MFNREELTVSTKFFIYIYIYTLKLIQPVSRDDEAESRLCLRYCSINNFCSERFEWHALLQTQFQPFVSVSCFFSCGFLAASTHFDATIHSAIVYMAAYGYRRLHTSTFPSLAADLLYGAIRTPLPKKRHTFQSQDTIPLGVVDWPQSKRFVLSGDIRYLVSVTDGELKKKNVISSYLGTGA